MSTYYCERMQNLGRSLKSQEIINFNLCPHILNFLESTLIEASFGRTVGICIHVHFLLMGLLIKDMLETQFLRYPRIGPV